MTHKLSAKSICIVTQLFHPNNQAIAVRMKYLADAFKNHGIDVSVMHSGDKEANEYGYKRYNLLSPVASNKDSTLPRIIKELISAIEVFWRVLFLPQKVFLITSPPFTIATAAVLACKLKSATYFFDVRDEYPDVYFIQGLLSDTSLIGKQLKRIESWIYDHSYQTLSVTNRIVDKIKTKTQQPEKVYLLRNGFTDKIKYLDKLQTEPFNILFHGNMGNFQDAELIVKIAQQCLSRNIDVNINIYGWGTKANIIESAAKELSNLTHFGQVSHDEIQSILQKSTLGIPFLVDNSIGQNAFPIKVTEYIGAGIPVLFAPCGETGEFLEKWKVGFQFSNHDVSKIVATIEELKDDPTKLFEMHLNAKAARLELSRKDISKSFVETFFIKN